jgi:hypothetical protein
MPNISRKSFSNAEHVQSFDRSATVSSDSGAKKSAFRTSIRGPAKGVLAGLKSMAKEISGAAKSISGRRSSEAALLGAGRDGSRPVSDRAAFNRARVVPEERAQVRMDQYSGRPAPSAPSPEFDLIGRRNGVVRPHRAPETLGEFEAAAKEEGRYHHAEPDLASAKAAYNAHGTKVEIPQPSLPPMRASHSSTGRSSSPARTSPPRPYDEFEAEAKRSASYHHTTTDYVSAREAYETQFRSTQRTAAPMRSAAGSAGPKKQAASAKAFLPLEHFLKLADEVEAEHRYHGTSAPKLDPEKTYADQFNKMSSARNGNAMPEQRAHVGTDQRSARPASKAGPAGAEVEISDLRNKVIDRLYTLQNKKVPLAAAEHLLGYIDSHQLGTAQTLQLLKQFEGFINNTNTNARDRKLNEIIAVLDKLSKA